MELIFSRAHSLHPWQLRIVTTTLENRDTLKLLLETLTLPYDGKMVVVFFPPISQ